jgi:small subunit ribosomal protein S8
MLTRIRNASLALLPKIELPHSRMKESIAVILKREGYIVDFAVEAKTKKKMTLQLKYQDRKPAIEGLRRVSTPGLRRYSGAVGLPRVRGGLGTAIISTSQGVMTGVQARKQNLGGEVLCYVW